MRLEFDKSFSKSLDKIRDDIIKNKTGKVINNIESADSINDIINLKKIVGSQNYYRIKIGDYRIGFELVKKSIIRLIIICHRKDIYKKFP